MNDLTPSCRSPIRYFYAYFVWRWFVGLLLIVAATLKVHNVSAMPLKTDSWMTLHVMFLVVAFVEYSFACLLLCNQFRKWLALACAGLFLSFAAVTARQVILNEASCGCLGIIEVPPIWMFLFDSVACFVFVWFARKLNPATQPMSSEGWRFGIAMIGITIAFLICRTSIGNWRAVRDGFSNFSVAESLPYRQGDFVKLEPVTWQGKLFPLSEYLEDSRLAQVDGRYLLYRKNCVHCREIIEAILKTPESDGKLPVIFVEIDGADTPAYIQRAADDNSLFHITSLKRKFRWLVEPPVLIDVRNGVVKSVLNSQ